MFGVPPPMMGMGMPGMGMGMGMHPGMLGMGMGMGGMMPPHMHPGLSSGAPFGFPNMNKLPYRFGGDVLGRQFAGPGGLGHSTPYKPPDPSTLHPMPTGLPVVARPPREGYDAYGRKIPPPPPPGFDGWGRPIPNPDGTLPLPPHLQPPPPPTNPTPGPGGQVQPGAAAAGGTGMGTRDMTLETGTMSGDGDEEEAVEGSSSGTGRPEEPPMFHRQPVQNIDNDYPDFQPFAFPSRALYRIDKLRRPPELKHCDIRPDEWAYFIGELEREAFAPPEGMSSGLGGTGGTMVTGYEFGSEFGGEEPLLTEKVHQMLREWLVGYFAPRGVNMYPIKDGKRLFGPSLHRDVRLHRDVSDRHSHANLRPGPYDSETDIYSDDSYDTVDELRYSARERAYRKRQRKEQKRQRKAERRAALGVGDWELYFCWQAPTAWRAGMKPIQYGEKIPFEKPKDY